MNVPQGTFAKYFPLSLRFVSYHRNIWQVLIPLRKHRPCCFQVKSPVIFRWFHISLKSQWFSDYSISQLSVILEWSRISLKSPVVKVIPFFSNRLRLRWFHSSTVHNVNVYRLHFHPLVSNYYGPSSWAERKRSEAQRTCLTHIALKDIKTRGP